MILQCPHCHTNLTKQERTFVCKNNHSFDLAKSGYLNLFINNQSKVHGDNKEMVLARSNFLSKNYYKILKDRLNQEIAKVNPITLCDLACGEGYYTTDMPVIHKIGIDLSKDAITYASKHDKSTQYIVASIFDCPIESESIDCMTTIFAPIAEEEIKRCLKPNGHFFCVFPAENHLYQLKEVIYDTPYKNEAPNKLTTLELMETIRITTSININNNDDLKNLFMMTPYYFKTSLEDKEKINCINNLDITIDFYLMHYKKA